MLTYEHHVKVLGVLGGRHSEAPFKLKVASGYAPSRDFVYISAIVP